MENTSKMISDDTDPYEESNKIRKVGQWQNARIINHV